MANRRALFRYSVDREADLSIVRCTGRLEFEQSDWDQVESLRAWLRRSIEEGQMAYVIDVTEATCLYPSSITMFLAPWLEAQAVPGFKVAIVRSAKQESVYLELLPAFATEEQARAAVE